MSGDHDPTGSGDDGSPDTEVAGDRAVLARIVDGRTAVLLVGSDGDELLLPASRLPDGSREGTWFALDLAAEPPTIVGIDHALTDARAADVTARLDRVRQQRRGGRFDR